MRITIIINRQVYNIYMMIIQMVICTIDHTDGDLHNDQQMVICLMIKQNILWYLNLYMGTFRVGIKSKLKSELKLSNMYAYGILL